MQTLILVVKRRRCMFILTIAGLFVAKLIILGPMIISITGWLLDDFLNYKKNKIPMPMLRGSVYPFWTNKMLILIVISYFIYIVAILLGVRYNPYIVNFWVYWTSLPIGILSNFSPDIDGVIGELEARDLQNRAEIIRHIHGIGWLLGIVGSMFLFLRFASIKSFIRRKVYINDDIHNERALESAGICIFGSVAVATSYYNYIAELSHNPEIYVEFSFAAHLYIVNLCMIPIMLVLGPAISIVIVASFHWRRLS